MPSTTPSTGEVIVSEARSHQTIAMGHPATSSVAAAT